MLTTPWHLALWPDWVVLVVPGEETQESGLWLRNVVPEPVALPPTRPTQSPPVSSLLCALKVWCELQPPALTHQFRPLAPSAR